MLPKQNPRRPASLVVATAHTAAGLRQARTLRRTDVGFVELRLDALAGKAGRMHLSMDGLRPDLLLTARHPAEGGCGALTGPQRRALLEDFLPLARAVDVELRSAAALKAVLQDARRRRIARVVSFHDFRRTPDLRSLEGTVRRAIEAGADLVKIATLLRRPEDLAVLLLLQSRTKFPLATMGMGPLGKVSRLVLAAAGSRLNYGYLDRPQVAGQWSARELIGRLGEVLP